MLLKAKKTPANAGIWRQAREIFSTNFQGIKRSPSLEGKSFCNTAISRCLGVSASIFLCSCPFPADTGSLSSNSRLSYSLQGLKDSSVCVCTSHRVLFLCAVVVERIKANTQCSFSFHESFLQAVSVTSVHILA